MLSSVNIMPMVIYEKLLYPAFSLTYMCAQLADSTIRYPGGIVENILVRVRDSFVLANFVVMDVDGNLGIELILRRPFLRPARARINVGRGEIHFCIGKENMFKFKQREEQRIIYQQDDEGQVLWDAPESGLMSLRPHNLKEDGQRRCGRRLQVRPRPLLQDEPNNGKSEQEKGPAHLSQNDEPFPKVNWYVSHIYFSPFYFS